ncbi:pyrroline-5-carboxylate reductase [Desulfobulbus alkaliphilus]|uniref:pyrroline-5-carboxylate reductase n=1 Tax=Desulfobulbus alkaliphilus TaxID=869814 RepID=UPI0019638ED4|nr:pyrroline-5-carboxylate reductase [Desulfobulbus alkaliphilus]MBM9537183.1 pyrroline-5-carboxylate reductase [Desulfobulbus alkaliphilus]
MALFDKTIGFIGGGQMAEALIRGLLEAGLVAADRLLVIEPDSRRMDDLQTRYGIVGMQEPAAFASACSVIVLAVKPQLAEVVLRQYRSLLSGEHLVLSVMAGVRLQTLAEGLEHPVRLIRVMPNTPALVLAGASAFSTDLRSTQEDRDIAAAMFSAVGICVEVEEYHLDAVTGLSGSGPGYLLTIVEAMIDGGVLVGLPRPVAEQLVLQTVAGTARLAMATGEHPAVLKGKVTSPGGTTIAGLRVLEKGALRGQVMEAVAAATKRSRELGNEG